MKKRSNIENETFSDVDLFRDFFFALRALSYPFLQRVLKYVYIYATAMIRDISRNIVFDILQLF